MTRVVCLIILVLFVFICNAIPGEPIILTLDKAVQLAVDRNITIIQAKNNFEGQQSEILAAYGGLLPSISLSGSHDRTETRTPSTSGFTREIPTVFTPSGGVPEPGTFTSYVPGSSGFSKDKSYSAGISANLTLFDGLSNTSNISRANSTAAAVEHTFSRTRQDIVYQTHQLFLNVVQTYQLLKVKEDNLKWSKQQLERIIESNKVGAVALADVYRQKVQAGTDEYTLIQAQNNYEKSKTDLLAFLGVDTRLEYDFDFHDIPTNIDTTEFKSLNDQYSDYNGLREVANSKRSDYKSAIENYNSTDASVVMARSAYFPSLSTNVSYGFNNSEFNRLTDNKVLRYGLNVSWSLFNGFATQNRIEQALIQRKNADEQMRQKERQVSVELKKALLDLEAAEKQVFVSQTTVESAEMDRQIAEEKYNLGAGTLLDLLDANAKYSVAIGNKVSAVVGYLLAKKQMEYAVGTLSK